MTRKGNKRSSILATYSCLDNVQEYIKVHPSKYNFPENEDLLFITNYKGKFTQLTVRTIQKLIDKYTSTFDEKRPPTNYDIPMLQIIIKKTRT